MLGLRTHAQADHRNGEPEEEREQGPWDALGVQSAESNHGDEDVERDGLDLSLHGEVVP